MKGDECKVLVRKEKEKEKNNNFWAKPFVSKEP